MKNEKASDLVVVTGFFLLPGESRLQFGLEIKRTLSSDEISELAELIRAEKQ